MIYPENFELKVGFDKIRNILKDNCLSQLGKDNVDEMNFSVDYDDVVCMTNQTAEFVRILSEEDEFPVSFYFDVRQSIGKIAVEGMFLSVQELFDLRRAIDTIGRIVSFFESKEESSYFYLKQLATDVFTFSDIIKEIDCILDKFGQIKDNASPRLLEVRRELMATQSGISKTLQSILRQAQADGFIEKDVNPAMRDGRLVIPVSPAFKRKLRGIVHDESATGKTVFIEPEAVVEANNKIRELESIERREIIKILTEISSLIRPRVPELLFSFGFLGQIDFIRAKALFSVMTNGILPSLTNDTVIDWSCAVHPLLYLSHVKQGKEVVPLDITLDKDSRILLISGPNAGGKSVCLKTVALLQYMLQCGMQVPMAEGSRMGFFKHIFIDIGDEQSIENDLSTYSSHLTNMKFFVKNCDDKSILLVDEFGGGTEPQIGGAIAESLLNHFNQKKAFGVITTHYTNLKHFATETDGIVNGAMLYDRHLMQPLFKLEIGNPGSSFAIEIARKIGLPESVIAEASEKVGADYINMDKYLQDIVRDKRYWESKRQNIRQKEKRIEEISEKYEAELNSINSQRKEILKEAKRQSKMLLDQTNAAIENTIKEIKEAQAEKARTKEIRQKFDEFKRSVDADEAETAIDKKIEKLKNRQKNKQTSTQVDKNNVELTVGDNVRVKGQTSIGEVLEINGKNVVVAFGSIKSNVKKDRLEKVSKNSVKKENRQSASFITVETTNEIRQRSLNFKREIDVRGLRGDEALQAVKYFIDDALMLNVDKVRILHGTGTGVLRQIIREYLSAVGGISSFHDEHVQFGGAGITVVEIG